MHSLSIQSTTGAPMRVRTRRGPRRKFDALLEQGFVNLDPTRLVGSQEAAAVVKKAVLLISAQHPRSARRMASR